MDTFAAIQQVVQGVFSDGKTEVENILLPAWDEKLEQIKSEKSHKEEYVQGQWWVKKNT